MRDRREPAASVARKNYGDSSVPELGSSSKAVAFTRPITAVRNTRNARRKKRQAVPLKGQRARTQRKMIPSQLPAVMERNREKEKAKERRKTQEEEDSDFTDEDDEKLIDNLSKEHWLLE